MEHISICICTFKRPMYLQRLLVKIGTQKTGNYYDFSVVIVDNDDKESGRSVVQEVKRWANYEISYDVEPERSISLARNRTVRNAKGNLIAFIDDDEFPDEDWLLNLYKALVSEQADGVLGPVMPHFENKPPRWLVKSGLLERSRFETGKKLSEAKHMRTGNVLLWRSIFDQDGGLFDPAYGKSGGGDAVFFAKMIKKGKKFVWCNSACVYETVPLERQTRMYHIRRAFTRGMTTSWEVPFFSTGTIKSVIAIALYSTILPLTLLLGQHLFINLLVKDCDHIAKLLGYLGIKVVQQRTYSQIT